MDSPPVRHYAYKATVSQLNDAFERIANDDGTVTNTFHLGGRDFVVLFVKARQS